MDKTLVIYYSRTGTTRRIAEQVASNTNADIYEITLAEALPNDMYAVAELATNHYETNHLPALNKLPVIDQYDTILIGGPVWSGKLATPIASLLQSVDFSNKNVAAFCTSTGSYAEYDSSFRQYCQTGNLFPGLYLVNSVNETRINQWVSQI